MIVSILESVKKVLGLDEAYKAFDEDVIMHINSVFDTLNQLGVGPIAPFVIEDDVATWNDFFGTEPSVQSVKSYMYLRVRLLFDPPATSFAIESFQKQIDQLEWRINAYVEGVKHPWIDPLATSSLTTE